MVAFRFGDISLATLDDAAFGTVLEAAETVGGPAMFPMLFSLSSLDAEIDPGTLLDELGSLVATPDGQQVAFSIGTLRDDLMEALAAAGEG